jgi:hypothetical protein
MIKIVCHSGLQTACIYVRSEVFTAVTMKSTTFCYTMPFRLVEVPRHFGGNKHFAIQFLVAWHHIVENSICQNIYLMEQVASHQGERDMDSKITKCLQI